MDYNFTVREWQVIDCLFRGICGKDIALELGVSARTVKAHVSSIGKKLGFAGDNRFIPSVRIVYLLDQAGYKPEEKEQ